MEKKHSPKKRESSTIKKSRKTLLWEVHATHDLVNLHTTPSHDKHQTPRPSSQVRSPQQIKKLDNSSGPRIWYWKSNLQGFGLNKGLRPRDIPEEQVGSVHMIQAWHSSSKRGSKVIGNWSHVPSQSIPYDTFIPSFNSVVITTMMASYKVNKIYIDKGSSIDIMYEHYFNKLPGHIRSRLKPPTTLLIGFSASKYNVIIRRNAIQKLSMEVLTIKSAVEFPIEVGITTIRSDYPGRDASLAAAVKEGNIWEIMWEPIPGDTLKGKKVIINPEYPDQPITIGVDLSPR
ncbi:hypothetical protein Tco_0946306 [Tanacetum coccineum]